MWARLIRSWSRANSRSLASVSLSRRRKKLSRSPSITCQPPSYATWAMACDTRRTGARLESHLLPISGHDQGVVSADVVSVDVEYLHRVAEVRAVAAAVEAMRDLLEPKGHGLLLVAHPRGDGRGHDLIEGAEVVPPVGEPGIDQVGLAHVLHPHRAVGLPALFDDAFRLMPQPIGVRQYVAVHVPPWTTMYLCSARAISSTCFLAASLGSAFDAHGSKPFSSAAQITATAATTRKVPSPMPLVFMAFSSLRLGLMTVFNVGIDGALQKQRGRKQGGQPRD